MVSTFTPNVQLEEPARGDQVGVWDTPVNNNSTLIDLLTGGSVALSLNNSNVTLSAGQFQSKTITFNSTLTGSVVITFPSSFKKSYEIQHLCTGSSAFTITLATTVANGQVICCPPGEIIDCISDGTNLKFKNLGHIGEYKTIAGSTMPNWITGCSVQPYLNCDGSVFSSVTYPALASRLGGTTLPDARGRAIYALDQGVGRVSSGGSNVAGNTLLAGGGDQLTQAHSHASTLNDPGHFHAFNPQNVLTFNAGAPTGAVTGGSGSPIFNIANTQGAATGISINNAIAGSGAAQNMPPLLVAGLTMIRAA